MHPSPNIILPGDSPGHVVSPLTPITRRALTDDVLLTLRKAIVAGAFAAGDHIPEARMAEQLGVSRVPVREAMMALEREGLLLFDSRGAARVRDFTPEDFEEIFTLRLALEPMAARRACKKLTPSDMASLEANISRMRETTCLLEVTMLDVEFHDLVVQAARHSRLHASWANLRSQLRVWLARLHRRQNSLIETRENSVCGHEEVLTVFRSGDAEAAATLMYQHLVSWRERVPTSMWGGNVL